MLSSTVKAIVDAGLHLRIWSPSEHLTAHGKEQRRYTETVSRSTL